MLVTFLYFLTYLYTCCIVCLLSLCKINGLICCNCQMSVITFEPLLQNRAIAIAPEACYYFSIILFITPEKLSTLENHELFNDRGTLKAIFWKVYCKMFTLRIKRIMIQLFLFVLIQCIV